MAAAADSQRYVRLPPSVQNKLFSLFDQGTVSPRHCAARGVARWGGGRSGGLTTANHCGRVGAACALGATHLFQLAHQFLIIKRQQAVPLAFSWQDQHVRSLCPAPSRRTLCASHLLTASYALGITLIAIYWTLHRPQTHLCGCKAVCIPSCAYSPCLLPRKGNSWYLCSAKPPAHVHPCSGPAPTHSTAQINSIHYTHPPHSGVLPVSPACPLCCS
jgi:hypothetical protein